MIGWKCHLQSSCNPDVSNQEPTWNPRSMIKSNVSSKLECCKSQPEYCKSQQGVLQKPVRALEKLVRVLQKSARALQKSARSAEKVSQSAAKVCLFVTEEIPSTVSLQAPDKEAWPKKELGWSGIAAKSARALQKSARVLQKSARGLQKSAMVLQKSASVL